jgi:drug/metabolite transporter (DMT)-like permease
MIAGEEPVSGNSMAAGVACGAAAGALWGLVFVLPEVASAFGPIQLAAGRYVVYGLFSLPLVLPHWRRFARVLGPREWKALAVLSVLGNLLYYVLLAAAVQLGGVAMTSLVIGFLPVAVTIIGSRDKGAIPLRRLMPSLALSAIGILCIGWESLGRAAAGEVFTQAAGLFCAVGALISWTAFAVGNSRWLGRLEDLSGHDWSLLIGIVTGIEALVLLPPALILEGTSQSAGEWTTFAGACAGVALLSSILGNSLWNRMSRLLPLTMVGQMILFETLFALLYGFLWDQRLPTAFEALAIVLVLASVLSCLSAHRPDRRRDAALAAAHD